ncbi:MAG: hypothetical protein ACK4GQ_06255, partial [Candidatus Hadarchaeales archaeon]
LKIRGYASEDNENVHVYIWENYFGVWRWRYIGVITSAETTIAWSMNYTNVERYLVDNAIHVRYLENAQDSIQTILHIDLCLVAENLENLTPPFLVNTVLTDNFYTFTFPENGRYWWRVMATVQGIAGDWSNIWVVRADTVAPEAPTLISPVPYENLKDTTPLLRWQAPFENSLPVKFFIQVATDPTFDNIIRENWVVGEQWEIYPPLQENVYYWTVLAVDNAGNSSPPSSTWQFRVDITPPATPETLSPRDGENLNDNTPQLMWTSVWDVSRPVVYHVQVAYDDAFQFIVPGCDVYIYENSWTTPELPSERVYRWRIKAIDNAGNESSWSPTRKFRFDRSPPLPPTLISPTANENIGSSTPMFTWE